MVCVAFAAGVIVAAPAKAQQSQAPATSAPAQNSDFVEEQVGGAPAPQTQGVTQSPQGASAAPAAATAAPASAAAAAQPSSSLLTNPVGFLNNIQRSSSALGDLWGLRPALARYGATLTIQEQSEIMGNASGGTGNAMAYEGLTTATLQVDTQRAFGLYGGLFNASGLWVHGGNLSTETLQTLQTASGIEALPSERLWELWYQQKFFDDRVDIRIGQQSIDQEFMVSQNAGYFINTMMGWPMLPSADMPGGGPAYPLSALGVRARVHVTDDVTLLAGVYSGSPAPGGWGANSQLTNCCGTSFTLGPGVLAIAELQYSYPGPNTVVQAGQADPLSRTYKIGFWYNSGPFQSQQYDTNGLPLANPASNGNPQVLHGDYAFYGVADQMLYRFEDPDRSINFFVRPMFTPLQDRNLIGFSVNGGFTMHEPVVGRDDDVAGIGILYTNVTSGASGFDQQTAYYNPGVYSPIRSAETVIEATYQYEVTPWLQIQPDAQYVINPGAGIVNPNDPTSKIRNEAVFGVRFNMQL